MRNVYRFPGGITERMAYAMCCFWDNCICSSEMLPFMTTRSTTGESFQASSTFFSARKQTRSILGPWRPGGSNGACQYFPLPNRGVISVQPFLPLWPADARSPVTAGNVGNIVPNHQIRQERNSLERVSLYLIGSLDHLLQVLERLHRLRSVPVVYSLGE